MGISNWTPIQSGVDTGSIVDSKLTSSFNNIDNEFTSVASLISNTNLSISNLDSEIHESGWRDNVAQFSAAKGNGTTEPIWKDIGNGTYMFEFTNNDELFTTYHINHDVKIGGKCYPHIHWSPKYDMANGETITWELTYGVARGYHVGELLTGSTTTLNLVYTADGTEKAGEHMILECTDAQAFVNPEVDSLITMKCKYLDGSYNNPVWGIMADLHYESDSSHTLNKNPDFYN